ncbi:HIRA-interacting protein 3 [Carlito syrichta]|uniref:HIRA-interacting protein 3 n=1 Tax=Carlito syrichta TaxID=1868482 RepID=A0A3Q0ELK4_CARSF|nr:HIRA-interacting protein 3 [Carlito syrichta]
MAREKEMREFTRSFFRHRPDLSTLTHSIVRRRFLARSGRDHLEPEEKQTLKRLVEEELLKMQVDEAGTKGEKPGLTKKVKRLSTPCSDPERKRLRFNSESEPSSAASSPDPSRPPATNGMAAAEVSPAKEESPRQASEKAAENSSEEWQRDLTAKMGEEEEDKEEKEYKGRIRKKPVTRNKLAPGNASVSKKQAREESEDSEEEHAQKTAEKVEGHKGAKSHRESEQEEEENLAKKKENRGEKGEEEEQRERGEEGEDWKPRAGSNGGKRSAWEERSCKQQSRTRRLMGNSGDSGGEKKKEEGSGANTRRDEDPLVQRKCKDKTQCKGGKRRSGSSEDGEDSWKVQPTAKGTKKVAKLGSSSEESDSEREVSDSEAKGNPKGERKNRSSKKTSRKGRTRSSSSSSDGSPEPKGGKTGSGRRGEDHPAVMRLKRYIRACGAHRNYKKLLGSCHSHKERLSVLRAELEALGMKGNPSLEKCRALKEQREEAAEVASLDIANIISNSGRPRRRTAWNPLEVAPPGEIYRRTLDSEEERPRPAPPDWSHMRGIISSDGESN